MHMLPVHALSSSIQEAPVDADPTIRGPVDVHLHKQRTFSL